MPTQWSLFSVWGCLSLLAILTGADSLSAQHRVLVQGEGKLAIVEPDGTTSWEMPWGGIHDVHVLENDHILVQRGAAEVVEIDPSTKAVVWSYNAAESNGNAGKPVEVHAFQPLGDGRLMIAESGPARIIEIDREGKLLREIPLKLDRPHPHHDTRLARKLPSGNYLVAHENDGFVREYEGSTGKVVWQYEVPLFGRATQGGHGPESFGNQLFAAVRLENGNTLIATGNGHSVLEVNPQQEVIWKLEQQELPGITLAWVTTLEVLADGSLVIGNCHAGPGQPLLVKIDRESKKVLWTFDRFDDFGNSVPNTQLLDLETPSIR